MKLHAAFFGSDKSDVIAAFFYVVRRERSALCRDKQPLVQRTVTLLFPATPDTHTKLLT